MLEQNLTIAIKCMEYLGIVMPSFDNGEYSIITNSLLIIGAISVAIIMIILIRLYFRNMELKQEPEKNQAEINNNIQKIEKIKKMSLKIGGIIFGVIVLALIITSNFIEF